MEQEVINELNHVSLPNPNDVKDEWFYYFDMLKVIAGDSSDVETYIENHRFTGLYNPDLYHRVNDYLYEWQNDAAPHRQ